MATRRGNHEGSIFQRKSDGLWGASLSIEGTGRRKTVYGKTKQEVIAKLKQLERDQAAGRLLLTQGTTVSEYLLDHWLEQTVRVRNKVSTYESYLKVVKLYINPYIGTLKLDKLSHVHVQRMLNQLLDKGYSTRTVHYVRSVLRRALGQALKWELVTRNVATLVDAPRLIKHQIAPLDEAQAKLLLKAARGNRLEALYHLAVGLGMRKGELLALRWEDIDFEEGWLRVTGTVLRTKSGLLRTTPKSVTSQRKLSLPPNLVEALRQHREQQALHRAVLGDDWPDTGLVFCSQAGTMIDPRNIITQFKKLVERAELPADTRFHDLRHTCATLLIAQGVHLSVIKEILGHSQISVTADIYGHVLPATQRAALEQVGLLFTGGMASWDAEDEEE